MSVMEARLGGRRVAARNAAERRKKIILASLIVLFVALMAFQLPKLLKGSESSATAPVPVSAVPATAGAGSVTAVASAPVRSSARVRAIRRMSARDPFVPLIRENAATASAAPATSSPRVRRAVGATVPTRVIPLRGVPRAVKPTAAVLLVNGRRQVLGVREAFGFGEATFRDRLRRSQDHAAPGLGRFLRGRQADDHGAQGPPREPRQHGDRREPLHPLLRSHYEELVPQT